MERVIVFLAQFLTAIVALAVWVSLAGDGPGAGFWVIVETIPVIVLTFIVCAVTIFLRRKMNQTVMSSVIIALYLCLRLAEGAFSISASMAWYAVLHPILPEVICLAYYQISARRPS